MNSGRAIGVGTINQRPLGHICCAQPEFRRNENSRRICAGSDKLSSQTRPAAQNKQDARGSVAASVGAKLEVRASRVETRHLCAAVGAPGSPSARPAGNNGLAASSQHFRRRRHLDAPEERARESILNRPIVRAISRPRLLPLGFCCPPAGRQKTPPELTCCRLALARAAGLLIYGRQVRASRKSRSTGARESFGERAPIPPRLPSPLGAAARGRRFAGLARSSQLAVCSLQSAVCSRLRMLCSRNANA